MENKFIRADDVAQELSVSKPNASLYRENQVLSRKNSSLNAENAELKEQNRDYKLLRKVFGSKQIDGLLEQAKQSKQRDKRFRDNKNER